MQDEIGYVGLNWFEDVLYLLYQWLY